MIAAFIPFMFILPTHWQILWALSAASMIGGNLLALREMRVKRILAYSSIAHVGYMLVGYLAGPGAPARAGEGLVSFIPLVNGPNSVLFYVVAYALSILGAFVCISLIEREHTLTLNNLHGLARRKPVIASCILVFVVSAAVGVYVTVLDLIFTQAIKLLETL
jgi:NADH-quinone oxidoreductase subunit N